MLIYLKVEPISFQIEFLKILLITLGMNYTYLKITNKKIDMTIKNITKIIFFMILILTISWVTTLIKFKIETLISRLFLIFAISSIISIFDKKVLGYEIMINTISLSINYVLFFVGIIFSFVINIFINIQNDFFNLLLIGLTHIILLLIIGSWKRIKFGISYLTFEKNKSFLDILILTISICVLLIFIILGNLQDNLKIFGSSFITFLILPIIMFLTIKKSIEAYYKQKLLIKELNETKENLKNKNKEIEELEKENLSFNKRSHSLAYKQKSLEFKLNKLLMKTEFAKELGLTDELINISKQLKENEKLPELEKTGILEVDDMLGLMQEECRKNDIDFSLQIKGNIYQMTNNFVDKEDLAILLADHIKDAIIAINHTDTINKSIMVRLGKIDDYFAVYIYDSGIEFPETIFEKLGKEPITTYPNEGGTGMGFMNTFDVLAKNNASLIIENLGKPSKDNYTKIIKIIFDNKNKIMFDKTNIL